MEELTMDTALHFIHGAPRKTRVLIVENESGVRELYARRLRAQQCEPVIAEGRGEALLQDDRTKAAIHCCQVALVDMRLLDDSSWRDTSGLNLVPALKPTISIIVTGHGDEQ